MRGFEYRIDKADTHLFITNKVGKDIVFKFGKYKGKPIENEQLTEFEKISITEEQFVELVERLAFEADKIITRTKKKEPKAVLDFGDKAKK